MGFDKDFVWGAATVSYQVEGKDDRSGITKRKTGKYR